jgi:integrase/recombinase XerD
MKPPAPLVPCPPGNLPSTVTDELPDIIYRAGSNAVFAAQEFFFGMIRNEHTQRAYLHAVKRFLKWGEKHGGGG